jgi:hypothetical protein
MLTTVTLALVCGGIPARAQEDSDDPAMMQHSEEAQQNQGDEEGTRMMGHGMMRQCMRQLSVVRDFETKGGLNQERVWRIMVDVTRLVCGEATDGFGWSCV